MPMIFLISIAVVGYSLAALLQGLYLAGYKIRLHRLLLFSLGWPAIWAHAWLLYNAIDVSQGQNLTFFNLVSLVAWLIAGLILIANWTKPVANLLIAVFPLAALALLLAQCYPSWLITNTKKHPDELWHILLSTAAFSVLSMAALQALLLAVLEWRLNHRKLGGITRMLPPLETMEALLFQMLALGFILLTVVLATSLWSFYPIREPQLLQKAGISLLTWGIFAVLLWGRYYSGWRGRKTINWTIGGVMLLTATYYGSTLLLEYSLH